MNTKINTYGYRLTTNPAQDEKSSILTGHSDAESIREAVRVKDFSIEPQITAQDKKSSILNRNKIVNLERPETRREGTVTIYEKKENNYYRYSYYKDRRKIHIHLGNTQNPRVLKLVEKIKALKKVEEILEVIKDYKTRNII